MNIKCNFLLALRYDTRRLSTFFFVKIKIRIGKKTVKAPCIAPSHAIGLHLCVARETFRRSRGKRFSLSDPRTAASTSFLSL